MNCTPKVFCLTFGVTSLTAQPICCLLSYLTYYADRLCVVPKYLSEVSRRVSGYGANYWIMRYTIQDLRNHFRNRKLTVNDIARKFHFSSVAYLNRYVQTHLGVAVAELQR